MRNISALFLHILLLFSCSSAPGPDESWIKADTSGEDYFWSTCAFLSSSELDELDALQKKLMSSDSLTNDKTIGNASKLLKYSF